MARQANPRTSVLSRLTVAFCVATVLLLLLPCFTSTAFAQTIATQSSTSADHCAPCCKPDSSISAPALCCATHQHAAQTMPPVDAGVPPLPILTPFEHPAPKLIAAAHSTAQASRTHPPLLTILRI